MSCPETIKVAIYARVTAYVRDIQYVAVFTHIRNMSRRW